MRKIACGVVAGLALVSGVAQAAYSLGNQVSITLAGAVWQVRIGDVTGDGRNDVVALTNNNGTSKLHVFAQKTDGTLTNPPRVYALPESAMAMEMADLNRDGIQDVVVGGYSTLTVLRSDTVTPVPLKVTTWTTGTNSTRIGLAKIDRDDFLDIVSTSSSRAALYFRGDGKGGLSPTPLALSRSNTLVTSSWPLELADVDGNGAADILSTDFHGIVHITYNNHGHDFLRSETIDPGFPVSKVVARDINGDGLTDLIVSGWSGGEVSRVMMYVYYQQPRGERFPQGDVSLNLINAQWGLSFDPFLAQDLDNDGDVDLLTAHPSGSSQFGLLANNGDSLGAEVLQNASWGDATNLAAGDINGDGCADVVVASSYGFVGLIYGSGCTASAAANKPDLRLGLSATATAATIKLSTIYSTLSINQPLVEVAFSLTAGSLEVGTLPANCQLRSQSVSKAQVDCLVATMGAAASKQLSIPVQVTTPPGVRARLGVAARALTDSAETSKANNAATATVGIVPVPVIVPTRTGNLQTRTEAVR
ncbi:FG-GAP repeat domain-containing protein [Lysobacter tyrosinilyticus]